MLHLKLIQGWRYVLVPMNQISLRTEICTQKRKKKKKKTVLLVHRRWGFVDEQGCKLISFCYQTISLKTLFIHVFTINLSSHSHCVDDDCSIMNVDQM